MIAGVEEVTEGLRIIEARHIGPTIQVIWGCRHRHPHNILGPVVGILL